MPRRPWRVSIEFALSLETFKASIITAATLPPCSLPSGSSRRTEGRRGGISTASSIIANIERSFCPKKRSAAVVPSGRMRRKLCTAVKHARFLGWSSPRSSWLRDEREPWRPSTLELERWNTSASIMALCLRRPGSPGCNAPNAPPGSKRGCTEVLSALPQRSALPARLGGRHLVEVIGPPAANTGKFTVRAVAEIITLWPRQERLSNSWKINGHRCAHCTGFLATPC